MSPQRRANHAQLAEPPSAEQVPFNTHGVNFWRRKIVKVAMAALSLACKPSDDQARPLLLEICVISNLIHQFFTDFDARLPPAPRRAGASSEPPPPPSLPF